MPPVMQMGTRRPHGCQLGLASFPSVLPLLVGCSGLTSCPGGCSGTGPRWLSVRGLRRVGMLSRAAPTVCFAASCTTFLTPSQINNLSPTTLSTSDPVLLILHPNLFLLAQMALACRRSLLVSLPGVRRSPHRPCTLHHVCWFLLVFPCYFSPWLEQASLSPPGKVQWFLAALPSSFSGRGWQFARVPS